MAPDAEQVENPRRLERMQNFAMQGMDMLRSSQEMIMEGAQNSPIGRGINMVRSRMDVRQRAQQQLNRDQDSPFDESGY